MTTESWNPMQQDFEHVGHLVPIVQPATLAEFLHARIDEDENGARRYAVIWSEDLESVSPRRLLAECEAKRKIIALHANLGAEYAPEDVLPICAVCENAEWHDAERWPCPTLRLLALPYSDHPDHREEWRT